MGCLDNGKAMGLFVLGTLLWSPKMPLLPLEAGRNWEALFMARSLVTTWAVPVNVKDKNKLG